jgi:hypothetical protein
MMLMRRSAETKPTSTVELSEGPIDGLHEGEDSTDSLSSGSKSQPDPRS